MPKYLILKHYRGAPATVNDVSMDQWAPEEVDAHMQFMDDFGTRLEESGEYVDAQALSPEGAWVRADEQGGSRRPTARSPRPRTSSPGGTSSTSTAGTAPSSWPASCRRPRARTASRSTSGSRCAPSTRAAHRRPSDPRTRRRRRCGRSSRAVIGVLVRRGADFATAEDAVQEALVGAHSAPGRTREPPRDLKGWLVTVAWRRFLDVDAVRDRAAAARGRRRPRAGGRCGGAADDTLRVFFLCAHPSLTPASAVALTLRAVAA